jgi:glutathione S-transferase
MRLFHRQGAGRPIRVAWVLEEVGEPYELTVITSEDGAGAEHRARHPLGRVPVLEDDQGFVFESAAICMHLADLHPDAALMPPLGTHERALAYQWTVFVPAELEPPLIEAAMYAESDPERAAKARVRFGAAVSAACDALEGKQYLLGERFTVADVFVSGVLGFAFRVGLADEFPDGVKDYVARQTQRPACVRAGERLSAS